MTAVAETGVSQGALMAVPLDLTTPNAEAKLERILTEIDAYPERWRTPVTPDRVRGEFMRILHHPEHLTWEVWREGELVGILLLWRIVPKQDALFHFLFFDRNLVGKIRLLRRFLRFCFEDLGFQRVSMEVPEDVEKLISFVRRKLSFRYEGEAAVKSHPLLTHLERATGSSGNPHIWVARMGSRRERAHWRDGTWVDLCCLRLTAPEFLGRTSKE
jgi:RimJ/RimL family protein N-acetyltransferase